MKDDFNPKPLKDQSGQTIVEFILFACRHRNYFFYFLSVVNNAIADRWETIATIILEDDGQRLDIP